MKRTSFLLSMALAWSAAASPASALDAGTMWQARFSSMKGDTSCSFGDAHCNRCVVNVSRQFKNIANGGRYVEMINGWTWKAKPYEPSDIDPAKTWTLLPGGFAVPFVDWQVGPENGSHFQSLVRSQASSPNLFATYGGRTSAIFAVDTLERKTTGEIGAGDLEHIYAGATTHPGGMAAVGEHIIVASDDDTKPTLQFINGSDGRSPGTNVLMNTKMANVSAARLAGGGYLLLTTTTSKKNEFRLWYTASLDDPRLEAVSPEVVSITGEGKDIVPDIGGFHGFENTTLVTECGTGDVYMVGVNGDPAISASNKGYWGLYQLSASYDLTHVNHNTKHLHGEACNTRASGSAFAGPDGELVLYCHQKGQRASQRADGINCAATSALGIPDVITIPLLSDEEQDDGTNPDGSIDKGRAWRKFKKVAKHFAAATGAVILATTPGVAETAIAIATTAVGTAAATATTAVAVAGTVAGTGIAVGATVATNIAVNTILIPGGACSRAITPADRILYTEIWPTDDP